MCTAWWCFRVLLLCAAVVCCCVLLLICAAAVCYCGVLWPADTKSDGRNLLSMFASPDPNRRRTEDYSFKKNAGIISTRSMFNLCCMLNGHITTICFLDFFCPILPLSWFNLYPKYLDAPAFLSQLMPSSRLWLTPTGHHRYVAALLVLRGFTGPIALVQYTSQPYLIFVISFTQAGFSNSKFYT